MTMTSPAAWTVAEVEADRGWIYPLSTNEADELIAAVRAAVKKTGPVDRPILDWKRDDFALEKALPTLAAAFREVRDGRAMALVKNLPREGVTPMEFRLMTWAAFTSAGASSSRTRWPPRSTRKNWSPPRAGRSST